MVILIPTPYRHNITFYLSFAFFRRRRITFTTDIKPFDFIFVNSPFLLVITLLFFLQAFLNALFDIPVAFEAVYRDVKVLGYCLMSFLSIWNHASAPILDS